MSAKTPTPAVCHHCAGQATRAGRMTTTVEDVRGRSRRLHLCGVCVAELASSHELTRHRRADRRAA